MFFVPWQLSVEMRKGSLLTITYLLERQHGSFCEQRQDRKEGAGYSCITISFTLLSPEIVMPRIYRTVVVPFSVAPCCKSFGFSFKLDDNLFWFWLEQEKKRDSFCHHRTSRVWGGSGGSLHDKELKKSQLAFCFFPDFAQEGKGLANAPKHVCVFWSSTFVLLYRRNESCHHTTELPPLPFI